MDSLSTFDCQDFHAKPFVWSDEAKQDIKDTWREIDDALPCDLKAPYLFTVYWWSSTYTHTSLVFTSDEHHFCTAELGFSGSEADGTLRVRPYSEALDRERVERCRGGWKKIGHVYRSTNDLISTGLQEISKFGAYHKIKNNCQDYCNLLLEELGLPTQTVDRVKTAHDVAMAMAACSEVGIPARVMAENREFRTFSALFRK